MQISCDYFWPYFLKSIHQTTYIIKTKSLFIRDAESQALPKDYWMQNCILARSPRDVYACYIWEGTLIGSEFSVVKKITFFFKGEYMESECKNDWVHNASIQAS